MADELIDALREEDRRGGALCGAAADEIERLRAALRDISDAFGCECGDQARAALVGTPK